MKVLYHTLETKLYIDMMTISSILIRWLYNVYNKNLLNLIFLYQSFIQLHLIFKIILIAFQSFDFGLNKSIVFLQQCHSFTGRMSSGIPQVRISLDVRKRHSHVFQAFNKLHKAHVLRMVIANAVLSLDVKEPLILIISQCRNGQPYQF